MSRRSRSHQLERWGLALEVAGLAGFILSIVFIPGSLLPAPRTLPAILVLLSCMALISLGAALVIVGRRRGSAEVLRYAGHLCTRCRYPLPETHDLGVCPECGDPFDRNDTLAAWRNRYPGLRL